MSTQAIEPLRFDFQGAFFDDQGFSVEKLHELAPKLEAARTDVAETDLQQYAAGGDAIPQS